MPLAPLGWLHRKINQSPNPHPHDSHPNLRWTVLSSIGFAKIRPELKCLPRPPAAKSNAVVTQSNRLNTLNQLTESDFAKHCFSADGQYFQQNEHSHLILVQKAILPKTFQLNWHMVWLDLSALIAASTAQHHSELLDCF